MAPHVLTHRLQLTQSAPSNGADRVVAEALVAVPAR
jgi:hypothetical protein